MAIEIGALRALLSLNSAAFDAGAARARASMNRLQRSLSDASKKMRRVGRQMTLRMTLPMAAMGTMAVRSSLKTIDAQAKMAKSFNASTKSMQIMQRAATRAGVSQGELEQMMRQLTKRMSEAASGTGPAADALERLGLTAEDLLGLDMNERFTLINQAIRDTVPAAEQAAIATDLFGSRAGLMASRLDPNTIATAAQELTRFGVAVSDVDAAKIEQANDAMSSLSLITKGLANRLTVALAPALKSMSERLASLSERFASLSPETQKLIGIVGGLTVTIGPALIALGLMASGLAAIATPVGLVVIGLAAVGAAAVYVATKWESWKAKFPIIQKLSDVINLAFNKLSILMSSVFDSITGALTDLVAFVKSAFQGDLQGALGALQNFAGRVRDWFVTIFKVVVPGLIRAHISKVVTAVSEWVASILAKVSEFAADMIQAGKDMGKDLIDGIKQGIEDQIERIRGAVANSAKRITSFFKDGFLIRSPSRVFKRIGHDLMDGLAVGVDEGTETARGAAERATGEVNAAFAGLGGDSVRGPLSELDSDLQGVIDRIEEIQGGIGNLFDGFRDGIAKGDIAGGFKSLVSDIGQAATQSFSNLLGGAFSQGGGGFGGLVSGLGDSFKSGIAALKSIGTGGGFLSGIGGAVSSFLPVIGAVSGVIGLIKGFSSKTTIGGGLNLGFEGGNAAGGTFETIRKTSFWGLRKKTYDVNRAFDQATQDLFNAQAESLRGTVTDTYTALGLRVSDAMLDGVNLAVQRIDTNGLSEEEIDARVEGIFRQFGDAMSQAIGGINLESAVNLNNVQAVLASLGKAFENLSAPGAVGVASVASDALLALTGGIDALAAKSGAFYDRFFSDAEKLGAIEGSVSATFGRLGLAIPATDSAFRDLVLSQDLLTDAGRRSYSALLDIAPMFDVVTDAMAEAAEAAQIAAQELATAIEAATSTRDALVFDLQPEATQLTLLQDKLKSVFSSLGFALPSTLDGLRGIVSGLDVTVDAGRSALEQIAAIVPDFRRVMDAISSLRPALQLNAKAYETEFEARYAAALASAGQYNQDIVTQQNATLQQNASLLSEIRDLLQDQNRTAEASFGMAQLG